MRHHPVIPLLGTGLLIATLSAGSCGRDELADVSLLEALRRDADYSTFVSAIETVDLQMTLTDEGPFTIIGPTNASFDAMDPDDRAAIFADEDLLSEVVLFHVGLFFFDTAALGRVAEIQTAQGANLRVSTANGVRINGVLLEETDLVVDNGVIHKIPQVLIPATVSVQLP
jgi:uncharacterized surface protein with fasciclin (FAS1) repeats